MAVLAAATLVGATTLTLTGPTAPAPYFIVGRNLVEAELVRPLSVVGKTVTLAKPLVFAKPAKCIVQPFDGGVVPWPWYGGRAEDAAAASLNVASFNRLALDQLALGSAASGVFVPPGRWYVNDQLRPEREQTIRGHGLTSSIWATPDFPFDDTGEVAIIHPQNNGNPVGYQARNNTTRLYVDQLHLDGGSRPNSNGMLLKVQQPASFRGLRIDNCLGLYGLCVMGQDGLFDNIELIGNAVPLRIRECKLMRFSQLNIEQTKGPAQVTFDAFGNYWLTFNAVHFEPLQETVGFDVHGGLGGFACRDLYYANPTTGTCFRFDAPNTNPGGAARYILENIWCNNNSNTYKMVDDIQRGKSLNSFSETDRWIDFLTPRVLVNGYTKTP